MPLPDFIIIGAMKCGTSTLATQLGLQDGIFITTPKEPNFFSDDDIHARGLAWYESLFDDAAPGDLKGEASTHYTKRATHPEAVARMAAVLDAPRLIYLIRDPVARLVSHYIHEWSMGTIRMPLEAALDRHPELVDYSLYARQLEPYVSRFGAERILVTSLEAMQDAPQRTLEQVCVFIGHDRQPVWQADHGRENASAERIRRFPFHKLLFDNPVATTLRRTLVPQTIRDRIKRRRQMQTRPNLPTVHRRELEARFAEDFAALQRLLSNRPDLARSYPFLSETGVSAS
jgi:hypothetical protein